MNVCVASRVGGQLKTYDLSKLVNFKYIPELLGFDDKYPAGYRKSKSQTL